MASTLDIHFTRAVHTALKQLRREDELSAHSLTRLIAVEKERCQQRLPDTDLGRAIALRQILRAALDSLSTEDAVAAGLIERRFWQGHSVVQLAQHVGISESTFYERQCAAIQSLAHQLWTMEQAAQQQTRDQEQHLRRHLPPPSYLRLFGAGAGMARLQKILSKPDGPWLISIEGLGGLGKTAQAHSLACWAASTHLWTDIAWVSVPYSELDAGDGEIKDNHDRPAMTLHGLVETIATQLGCSEFLDRPFPERLAALCNHLRDSPHLIVVDNIRVGAASDTVLQLWKLARPSRFLLTSRHSLDECPWIFCYTLNELGETDALAMLRNEGEMRGITALAQTDDDALRQVYAVTGGNPLAIKLVAGQMRGLPLDRVLAHLREAAGQPYHDLYRFIYSRSWELLTQEAQQVLLTMSSLPIRGVNWAKLKSVTQFDANRLDAAIGELVASFLLDASGGNQRHYTIQRLTRSFLASKFLKG